MTRSWVNWAGLASATPARVVCPTSTEEVAAAVRAARDQGLGVKMVGSGHSFTDIAVTDGVLLRPDRLVGVRSVDRALMRVTVLAGTPLHLLNEQLDGLGLALHNLGDIDRQTVAGAISTGTHGSGGARSTLASQVAALELVTGEGEVLTVDADRDPALLDAARVGLGALGVLTAVTFDVEPAFLLHAQERPMTFTELVRTFDQLVVEHDHVDVHWFPYSNHALVKLNDRTVDAAAPLSPVRRWVDDELLSNQVFALTNRLGRRVPRTVPLINRVSSRALTARQYTDSSHRVFVAERKVRFREMEYAVPAADGMDVLVEARRVIDRGRWPIGFPVELRWTRGDDALLSPGHGRDSVHLAFHVHARSDHGAYFRAVEPVLRDAGGRPHWGKLHTRAADDLATLYPRWKDFAVARDRLDPDRLFRNAYLDRVLGR